MEVLPHRHVLLDELAPHLRELDVILVIDRAVMCARANHIEEGRNGVNRVPHEQDGTLSIELGLAISLWIMRLDDHDALVYEALASQSHQHQVLVQLLRDVAVRAGREAHDLLKIGAQQRIARAREADHDDRVLVVRLFLVDV